MFDLDNSYYRYNCGGFCLKTYNWYLPYPTDDKDERTNFIINCFSDFSYEEAKEIITLTDLQYIANGFELSYNICYPEKTHLKLQVGDILYRLAFPTRKDIEEEYYDYDFHFIEVIGVDEDGIIEIQEKMGSSRVVVNKIAERHLIEDKWMRGFWNYDGPIGVFRKNFTLF